MNFYVDASAVIALLLDEATSEALDVYVYDPDLDFMISDLAVAESSAALASHGRMRRKSTAEIEGLHAELDAWVLRLADPVEVSSQDIADAIGFIRTEGIALRAPDAIHIAAAHRLGATLLTLDRGMARAAAVLGVPYLNPAEAEAPGVPKD